MRWLRRPTKPHSLLGDKHELVTERLTLKRLSRDSVDGYLALFDEEFCAVHRWTQQHLEQHAKIREKPYWQLAAREVAVFVRSKQPLEVLGYVGLHQGVDPPNQLTIGVHLGPQHRGQGYMTEILSPVFEDLRSAYLKRPIILATSDDNVAMVRVCEKVGLSYEMRDWIHPDGSIEWVRIYGVANC